ncbi:MAG: biopolymer transporter ExbD [Leptospirales bacterium]|nr:biopolymer transporter ExbD [Leptospirales bacterium]
MRLKSKRRYLEEIPLASTADIAFLLIVFYLAASSLLEFRGVMLPLPIKDAPPMEILKKDIFRITINGAGQLIREGERVEWSQLEREVRDQRSHNKDIAAIISVSAQAPVEVVPRLIHLLQQCQVQRLSIAMEGR